MADSASRASSRPTPKLTINVRGHSIRRAHGLRPLPPKPRKLIVEEPLRVVVENPLRLGHLEHLPGPLIPTRGHAPWTRLMPGQTPDPTSIALRAARATTSARESRRERARCLLSR